MKKSRKIARRGRPRSFNEGAALEKAMHVFWRKGYDAAALSDLTKAMGINPPSLYAAFGNKESLFLKVLERYAEGPAAYVMKALLAPTAREVAERRLYGAVDMMCDSSHPLGCLAAQASAKCGDLRTSMGKKLMAYVDGAHQALLIDLNGQKRRGTYPRVLIPMHSHATSVPLPKVFRCKRPAGLAGRNCGAWSRGRWNNGRTE
jgi:AcrR family transcriptional regulator